jgi:hypothetical protein
MNSSMPERLGLERELADLGLREYQASPPPPATIGRPASGRPISASEIRAAAQHGIDLKTAERLTLIRQIGARLGIPKRHFQRGKRGLIVNGDVRLIGLLRVLATSRAAAANLKRLNQFVKDIRPALAVVTASRESSKAVTAQGSEMIETWHQGGLDFLGNLGWNRLGLPRSIIRHWRAAPPFRSPETGNIVHPAWIPARDQLLAYAAQTRESFNVFQDLVRRRLGQAMGDKALADMTDDARLLWQAYAFRAPGGNEFDPRVGPKHGKHFGAKTALGYLVHRAKEEKREIDLNAILTDSSFNRTFYVRSAKERVAEAVFLEELLKRSATAPSSTTP